MARGPFANSAAARIALQIASMMMAKPRHLESPQGGSSSTSRDQGPNPLQQMADIAFEQGSSSLLPEQRSSGFTPHQANYDFNVVVDPQSRSDI
ncbi:5345_t:CDS:2, partial [Acaulospora colombiana]